MNGENSSRKSNNLALYAFLICVLLACVLGGMAVAALSPKADHNWRDEQFDRIEVESAQSWTRLKLYAGYVLTGVTISVLAGAGWAMVMWLNKKATTINPTPAGIYPLVVRRLGLPWLNRRLLFFNPNLTLFSTTVVTDGPTVQVLHISPPAAGAEQMQVTSQAQAVQAIAAAAQGGHYTTTEIPALFTQTPPPRVNVLPPLLESGSMADSLLEAAEANWREMESEG